MRLHTGCRAPYRYQTLFQSLLYRLAPFLLCLLAFLATTTTSAPITTALNPTALLPLLVVILNVLHRLVVILTISFFIFFIASVGLPVERVAGRLVRVEMIRVGVLDCHCADDQLFGVVGGVVLVVWIMKLLLLMVRLVLLGVPLVVALLRARDVAGQAVEGERGHIVRPFAPQRRPVHHQLVRGVRLETEFIQSLLLKFGLSLGLFLLGEQELVEPERVDRLDLLFEHLGHRVPLPLQQVDQVHDFLLSQLEVGDFVLQG